MVYYDGVVHLHLRGTGEYVAADRAVQHTFADEARVGRLVTRATARNQADFVGVDVHFLDDLKFFHKLEFGMCLGEAVTHIVHKSFGGVHYFFHATNLLILILCRRTPRDAPTFFTLRL